MKVNIISKQELNYETIWAIAFDFKSNGDYIIPPKSMVCVDTGSVIQVPAWYMLQTASRSSTFRKLWLILVNCVWYIDQDYHGDSDTIGFQYFNMWDNPVEIKYWDRIGQWAFIKIEKAEFNYCDHITEKNRGGFWSTWK